MNIYSSAFNLITHQFEFENSISSFCKFADNVCISVNTSKDNTYDELSKLTKQFKNLHLTQTDISYKDPLLDGKIKNEALQFAETFRGDYFVGLDLDEEIDPEKREDWQQFARLFLDFYENEALLIPSVNLWGSRETVRWDYSNNKAYKWYLHKRGLNRGPIKQGIKKNGFLDISKTDGCEILSKDGDLAKTIRIDQELDHVTDCKEYYQRIKEDYIYVLHNSFADFNRRLAKVHGFWKSHWELCSQGENVNVIDKLSELSKISVVEHGLFN